MQLRVEHQGYVSRGMLCCLSFPSTAQFHSKAHTHNKPHNSLSFTPLPCNRFPLLPLPLLRLLRRERYSLGPWTPRCYAFGIHRLIDCRVVSSIGSGREPQLTELISCFPQSDEKTDRFKPADFLHGMEEAARDIHPNLFHVVACEVHRPTFIDVLRKGARKCAATDPLFYCGVSLVVVETRDHVELKEALSNRRIAHPF